MPLKADFHCHVKLLGHHSFRPAQLVKRLSWARRVGLDLLAVTEHIDLPDFWEIYEHLESLCRDHSGCFSWRGLTVLTGAEVNIYEGGHILMIGSLDHMRELEKRMGRLDARNFPFLKDLLDASEDLEFLRIGAHPCRVNHDLWKMGPLLKRLDALEINANELSMSEWVSSQSAKMGLPVLAGSDAHHWLQLGRVFNLLPYSYNGGYTVAQLKRVIARGEAAWYRPGAVSAFIRGLLKGGAVEGCGD